MDHRFPLTAENPQAGPPVLSGRLYLLIAPPPAVDRLMDALAVRLALAAAHSAGWPARQPCLRILDGGNGFDLHAIARGLYAGGMYAGGMYAGGIYAGGEAGLSRPSNRNPKFISGHPRALLQCIQVARAFTCYQMEALLAAACQDQPSQPDGNDQDALPAPRHQPVLALRLLTTFADGPFNDGEAPPGERLRLLERCIRHLKRLASDAPVLVSATPCPGATQQAALLQRLESAAHQVWRFETHNPAGAGQGAPIQLRLFNDPPPA